MEMRNKKNEMFMMIMKIEDKNEYEFCKVNKMNEFTVTFEIIFEILFRIISPKIQDFIL